MNVILAAVSCLLIQYCALIIPYAFSRRRYRKMALFIAAAAVAGVSFYVSLSRLPDSHRYGWEILEGAKARHMKGYGAVAEALAESLDPHLNDIIILVDEMRNLIIGNKKE